MKVLIYFLIMFFNFKDYYNEEVIPIYDKNGQIIQINYNITLGNKKYYLIKPDIFGALREYKSIDKNSFVKVVVRIKNKNYQYVENSFNIETDSFINDKSNYNFLNIEGFDGKKINSIFIPYKRNLEEKENDLEKIKDAYDNFYLNILDFSYDGKIYYNMDNYKDIEYKNGFTLYIRINENYLDIYKDYNYYGEISFKVKKVVD